MATGELAITESGRSGVRGSVGGSDSVHLTDGKNSRNIAVQSKTYEYHARS